MFLRSLIAQLYSLACHNPPPHIRRVFLATQYHPPTPYTKRRKTSKNKNITLQHKQTNCNLLHNTAPHKKKRGGNKKTERKRETDMILSSIDFAKYYVRMSSICLYMYLCIHIYIYTYMYADQNGQRGHGNITMFWSVLTCPGST